VGVRSRPLETLVARLPRRPLYVAAGLGVSGLSVFAFLAVSGRALGPERYAPLAALWSLVFLLGPGLFAPLEQELARAISARRATGAGAGHVITRAALAGGAFAGLMTIVALALSVPLKDRLFDGSELLVVGLALSLPGYACFYFARGVLAGSDRFDLYGTVLAAEGFVRLLAGAGLALAAASAGAYGLAVGLAPFVALPLLWPARGALAEPGPPAPWNELTSNLGWLLIGALLTQILVNAGPVVVKWLAAPGEDALAGSILAGLLITRVPLYLFQAVAAAMLPALSGFAAADDLAGYRHYLMRFVAIAGLLGVITVLGALVFGPLALELMFGAEYKLGRLDLLALAGSAAGVILANTFGSALIALGAQGASAAGWLAGTVVFVLVTALGNDLLVRVETGLLAGCVAAPLVMAALLAARLRQRSAGMA
jgi:O-antigen/teichoic acid export membrane protein